MAFCFTEASAQNSDVINNYEKQLQEQQKLAAASNTVLLPDINAVFDPQQGVKLDWYNQYDLIKTIAIQRSSDSVRNYSTIGYLERLPKGLNSYIDPEITLGKSYYRLLIVFSSDLNWYSNMARVDIDTPSFKKFYNSTEIIPVAADNRSNTNNNLIPPTTAPSVQINTTDPLAANFVFQPSSRIYYDIFDKQIHVNVGQKANMYDSYSLIIRDPATQKVLLNIRKLPKSSFIIDSRNINKQGYMKFELKKDGEVQETGVILIQ